jgi:hypothetical protein
MPNQQTNTLPYYENLLITAVKSFIRFTSGDYVIKDFTPMSAYLLVILTEVTPKVT